MRIYSLIAVVFLMSACAGNPPAWWNPSGTYGNTQQQTQTSRSGSSKISQEDETPVEQDIEPALDGYEEMTLAPIEQQTPVPSAEELAGETLADTSEQAQVPVPTGKEVLPEDGSLPEPSVLK